MKVLATVVAAMNIIENMMQEITTRKRLTTKDGCELETKPYNDSERLCTH